LSEPTDYIIAVTVGRTQRWTWIPLALPLAFVLLILSADVLEGPKTAYVGLLATAPMLAAVFGTPVQTAIVGFLTLLSGYIFGIISEDGNVPAQTVRLIAISIFSLIAILASRQRVLREEQLLAAQKEAAFAETMSLRARTDELTGVLNRRGAEEALSNRSQQLTWTVAIADCDDFKLVNDEHGHVVGDEYLRAIAQRMRAALPEKDILARWGGDEFLLAVALPEESAAKVFDRVHRQVIEGPIRTSSGEINAKLTLGIAQWREGEDVGKVIRRADRAMYMGKSQGANRIIIAP
jgi:diguanylate cyclase (GGDEF)-like protein